MGIVFCFSGIWGIITAILNLGWLSVAPIWWITFLAGNLISAILGFMLGSWLINKMFLSKNDVAKAKELRAKIEPKQGKLGIFRIIVGIWMVVASFLFTVA